MPVPPFLSIEDRVQYLYDREYFDKGEVTDAHVQRLARLNFHYFLGYARNYRALVGRGQVQVSRKTPDDVFSVIDLDAQVCGLLHGALRSAEWHLRALAVSRYCTKYPTPGSFLNREQYRLTEGGSAQRMVESILTHIYRHDEPFVGEHLSRAAVEQRTSAPSKYDSGVHERCLSLAADLPLWSVVDGFSLGLLGQFLMTCDTDSDAPLWKSVALDLGIKARYFETQVKSFAYLRNSVAHHARLWMRPTADSPKQPRPFKAYVQGSHPKSMHWAFMNLATFLPASEQSAFADQIEEVTKQNPLYRYGITQVRTSPSASE